MPYPSPLFASSAHAGDPCLAFAAIIVRKGTKAAVQRRPGEPHFRSTSVQNFRVGTLEGSQLQWHDFTRAHRTLGRGLSGLSRVVPLAAYGL